MFDGKAMNLYEYCGSDPMNGTDPTGAGWQIPGWVRALALILQLFKPVGEPGAHGEHEVFKPTRGPKSPAEDVFEPQEQTGPPPEPPEEGGGGGEGRGGEGGGGGEASSECSNGTSKFSVEYWEKVTGLTGTALLVYIAISEGSRLIPVRNLIPVP